MQQHHKHALLSKKNNDNFAPNEIAILGTKCTTISNLIYIISKKLTYFNLGYFDASHAKNVDENILTEYTFHYEGNLKISTRSHHNKYEQRLQFYNHDLVFINGNHYPGKKQIIILDGEKEASIQKRLSQITNIAFIIKLNKETHFFDCLVEKFPKIKKIKCYDIKDVDGITNHIESIIKDNIAPVKGLVLIGGKSTRMGMDKSTLNYYGKPQKEHLKDLFKECSLETFFSVGNISPSTNKTNEINDTFLNLGPFGGICSAFQKKPNTAWFVLATDIPFINKEIIQLLLENRDPSKIATTIKGKNKEFPEPLVTIYEPKAYGKLLQYLAQGYSCPRKMLINTDIKVIEVDDNLIRNINTCEEFKMAQLEIKRIPQT